MAAIRLRAISIRSRWTKKHWITGCTGSCVASVINLELAQSDIRLHFQLSDRALIFPISHIQNIWSISAKVSYISLARSRLSFIPSRQNASPWLKYAKELTMNPIKIFVAVTALSLFHSVVLPRLLPLPRLPWMLLKRKSRHRPKMQVHPIKLPAHALIIELMSLLNWSNNIYPFNTMRLPLRRPFLLCRKHKFVCSGSASLIPLWLLEPCPVICRFAYCHLPWCSLCDSE